MKFCDENCNECVLLDNWQLSKILNMLYLKFGDEAYHIIQSQCPNLTCCADCHIDDFCHYEGCKILKEAEEDVADLMEDKNGHRRQTSRAET